MSLTDPAAIVADRLRPAHCLGLSGVGLAGLVGLAVTGAPTWTGLVGMGVVGLGAEAYRYATSDGDPYIAQLEASTS